MSVKIINLPCLFDEEEKPYSLRQRNCPLDCERAAEAACLKHTTSENANLARWIRLMVHQLPLGRLTALDGEKAMDVLRACVQAKDIIEMDNDHYTWLKKILFDDGEGKRIHEKLGGSYALNLYGYVALAVKSGLEQLQPKAPPVQE